MSDINDNLPSIEDYKDNQDDLPSISDFISEEVLPSVEEFVEKKEEEEIVEETIEEPVEETGDLTEVLRLINSVRKDIPDIPEIRYYDDELKSLSEQIENLPEIKYYDDDISSLKEDIEGVRGDIPEVPEVRYYEEDISFIQTRIDSIKKDIQSLPQVKYYEEDIESLKTHIQEVSDSIPVFPKWVNEVNEVPDFSWIGKTFSVIDDDFVKVQDNLNSIQDRITDEVNEISESINIKAFENNVDLKELTKNLEESKDKIYKELKEYSVRVWEHHNTFKDDDRKLKKQLLGENNKLKQNLQKEILSINESSVKTDQTILGFFNELKNDVLVKFSSLPEVKYYDEDITTLGEDISQLTEKVDRQNINIGELYSLAKDLKEAQDLLKESTVVSGPDPKLKQAGDPLTPIDQEFDSLAKLAKSYKLFTARVQEQLWSIGGGGAAFIKDLDDVSFDQTTGTNKLLIYAGIETGWVGIASTSLSGAAKELASGCTGVDLTLSGDLNVGGDIVYDEVTGRNLKISGIATAGEMHVGVDTGFFTEDLVVTGNARVTGILTVGTASVTIDGSSNKVTVGTGITLNAATGKIEAPEIVTSGTTGAFYPPVLTTAQRDALTVTVGAMIFNTSTKKMEFYNGSSWQALPGMSLGLSMALDS